MDKNTDTKLKDINGRRILNGDKIKFFIPNDYINEHYFESITQNEGISIVYYEYGCFLINVPSKNIEAPYRIPFGLYPLIKIEVI